MINRKSILVIIIVFVLPLFFYFIKMQKKASVSIASKVSIEHELTLIDFNSPLCLECKDFDKVLAPVEAKYAKRLKVVQVRIDTKKKEEIALIKKYDVKIVPTAVLLSPESNKPVIFRQTPTLKELEFAIEKLLKD